MLAEYHDLVQASKKYTVNRKSPNRDCYNNSTIQVRKGLSGDDTSLCKGNNVASH